MLGDGTILLGTYLLLLRAYPEGSTETKLFFPRLVVDSHSNDLRELYIKKL